MFQIGERKVLFPTFQLAIIYGLNASNSPCRTGSSGRLATGDRKPIYERLLSLGAGKPRRRTQNDELTHPLLGDQPTLQLLPSRDEVGQSLHVK